MTLSRVTNNSGNTCVPWTSHERNRNAHITSQQHCCTLSRPETIVAREICRLCVVSGVLRSHFNWTDECRFPGEVFTSLGWWWSNLSNPQCYVHVFFLTEIVQTNKRTDIASLSASVRNCRAVEIIVTVSNWIWGKRDIDPEAAVSLENEANLSCVPSGLAAHSLVGQHVRYFISMFAFISCATVHASFTHWLL